MATQIDLGEMLEMLTLCEKCAHEAREAICMKRQMDKAAKQMASGLVVAGGAVLAQIQNGDARTIQGATAPTAEQQAFEQQHAAVSQLADVRVQDVVNIGRALGKRLGIVEAAA